MRAVSDAGPLIHLSWVDQLNILAQLFEEVLISPVVRQELLSAPAGTLGLQSIRHALDEGWLQVRAPSGPPRLETHEAAALDWGELDALQLAAESAADIFLTDDAAARGEAERRGLNVSGTIGVLARARDQGLIEATLPLLLELRRLGQWISEALLETVREEEAKV